MEFLINNWWYILLFIALAFIMVRGGGCCGGHSHGGHHHSGNNYSENSNNQVNLVRDPLCGLYVDPNTAIKEEIDGKTYYFCSGSCRTEFSRKNY